MNTFDISSMAIEIEKLKAERADMLATLELALGVLTDLSIDMEGEAEEHVAGVRLQIHELIEKAKGK